MAGKQITDKDPLTGRKAALDAQKHLSGKFETNPFKKLTVRDKSDERYTPFKGGEKK